LQQPALHPLLDLPLTPISQNIVGQLQGLLRNRARRVQILFALIKNPPADRLVFSFVRQFYNRPVRLNPPPFGLYPIKPILQRTEHVTRPFRLGFRQIVVLFWIVLDII